MKIAIFGTGRFYQYYKAHLCKFDIEYVIDNNLKKQGQVIDGRLISAPEEVDYSRCDYVVILVKKYDEIIAQLVRLGVDECKILTYRDMGNHLYEYIPVKTKEGEVSYRKWIENSQMKKVILFSHELSRTGVPVALMHLAVILIDMGYAVLYASMRNGNLSEELRDKGIDYIEELGLFLNHDEFLECTRQVDFLIVGTACLVDSAELLSSFKKPILWWMHETNKELLELWRKFKNIENIHFFCGGRRVVKSLRDYAGIERCNELLYFLPDLQSNINEDGGYKNKDKIRFALLGTISRRKAQDILGEATRLISKKYKDAYTITFVGAAFNSEQQNYLSILKEKFPDFCYKEEMSQEDLDDFYREIDVLVCPSRDDPMPIVVTQAMQHGIPCIVSDWVGQAQYIQHSVNGYVFANENCQELASIMEDILENPVQIERVGKMGRRVFEQYFSEECMRNKIGGIIEQLVNMR